MTGLLVTDMVDIATIGESGVEISFIHISEVEPAPSNFTEAVTSQHWDVWRNAMHVKYDDLVDTGMFKEEARLEGNNPIDSMWLCK